MYNLLNTEEYFFQQVKFSQRITQERLPIFFSFLFLTIPKKGKVYTELLYARGVLNRRTCIFGCDAK